MTAVEKNSAILSFYLQSQTQIMAILWYFEKLLFLKLFAGRDLSFNLQISDSFNDFFSLYLAKQT